MTTIKQHKSIEQENGMSTCKHSPIGTSGDTVADLQKISQDTVSSIQKVSDKSVNYTIKIGRFF